MTTNTSIYSKIYSNSMAGSRRRQSLHLGRCTLPKEQLIWHCRSRGRVEGDRKTKFSTSSSLAWRYPRAFVTPSAATTPSAVGTEGGDLAADIYGVWLRIVGDFCSRKLTFASEVFSTISSLAREVRAKTRDTYRAGLGRSDIARELLWSRRSPVKETPEYLALSWS